MSRIGVWELGAEGPKRVDESQVDFEKELETKKYRLISLGIRV